MLRVWRVFSSKVPKQVIKIMKGPGSGFLPAQE